MSNGQPGDATAVKDVSAGKDAAINDDFIDAKIRTKISSFLRTVADKVDDRSLTPDLDRHVSEFFLKYSFLEHILNDIPRFHDGNSDEKGDKGTGDGNSEGNSEGNDDLMQFLSLGWFVYSEMLKK